MSSAASAPDPTSTASVVPLVPAWRVDRAYDYRVPAALAPRVTVGSLVRVPFGARRVRGIVVELSSRAPDSASEEIAALVTEQPVAAHPQEELLAWLARRYLVPLGRAFERTVPARVRVKPGELQPLETKSHPEVLPRYSGGEALLETVREGRGGVWIVRPIPGSDRAALISELIAAAAHETGRQALVAVPEVRYGAPVLDALTARWPGVARVDSSVGEAERAHNWLRLAAGHGLGGGGRSAVLTPAPKLGLVVIDDEPHFSYKEDRSPRYDARRVAVERARLQGATCVLIGSTPTVTTGHRAVEGQFGLVEPTRAEELAARPIVETIEPEGDWVLTHKLHERIRSTLERGERAALLVPARGYARVLWCASCRRSVRCPKCESGLFYDRTPVTRVRCSHCRFEAPAPESCPSCGATDFRRVGAGTERLVEQLSKAFPRAVVRRMDPDVIGRAEEDLGPPDIYVTTWIGTKPAVRPEVGTVAVLDADSLLRRPDWRAAENAYHALAAMAEWAGPADRGGRLLVHTSEPGHYAVQAVVRGDYNYFLEREVAARRELGYPPFSELIRATAFGPRRAGVIERVAGVARRAGAGVLGPVELSVVVGEGVLEDALEVLIKAERAEPVCDELRGILAAVPAGSRLRLDVDPR